ncbi:hypothetical protein AAC387_Pa11g1032 [Persea americana]
MAAVNAIPCCFLPFSSLLSQTNLRYYDSPSLSTTFRSSKPNFPSFSSTSSSPSSSSSLLAQFPPKPLPSFPLQNQQRSHHQTLLLHPSNDADGDADQLFDRCLHLLRLCNEIRIGKSIHAVLAKAQDQDMDTRLANSLIAMYLRLGYLAYARTIFDLLSSPDVASYTTLISAYAKCSRESEAVRLFFRMRLEDVQPNEFTFVAILTACIRSCDLQLGSQVHSLAIKTDHVSCVFVSNALMGVYVKCGRINDALQMFDEMPVRDVASWNTVISGLVQGLRFHQAVEMFRDMQMGGFRADQFSLSSVLAAVVEVCGYAQGKEVHAHALRIGFTSNVSVNNALIGFYTKHGSVEDAVGLFERMLVRDVISWTGMLTGFMEFGLVESAEEVFDQMPERNCIAYNALLAGLCQNGEGWRALELFRKMVEDCMELSDFTLTSVVNSCAMLSKVDVCVQIHGFVVKVGFGSNAWIEAALLDMYTKCGRMDDAHKMLDRWMHDQSRSIAWTSLIHGHARIGQPEEALSLFCKLQAEDVIMDEVALATVLGICGALGFENKGKQIHTCVIKSGFISDLGVGNAMVSMYSKCGNMKDAVKIFNLMPGHDVVSWNTLIAGYLLDRQGDMALSVWTTMEKKGILPDGITFVSILSSCRHTKSNSVDSCRRLFLSMRSCYSIEPTAEHYAAMVDVLGSWNCFEEAEKLIEDMPFKPNASVWRALLDSCRLRSKISVGKRAAQRILALEPQDPSSYILASNLYSASGRWHCSERLRQEMRDKGLHKNPARSWIIHQNAIHSFYARDKSHPQTKDIYRGLEILIVECMKVGYVLDTSFVLHEVEEYQKKDFLFYHSAKLAAAYGLLMTVPGKPVRVVKNIHLCGDCHTFLKCASVATGREISLRDRTGFHCFRSGECSCGDYW